MSFACKSAVAALAFALCFAVAVPLGAQDRAAARIKASPRQNLSPAQLAALGLGGLEPMSDQEGMNVRGSGFFAFRSRHVHKSTVSFRGLNQFFLHKFKFVIVAKFRQFHFQGFSRISTLHIGRGIVNFHFGGFAAGGI
jgi:hypothetical protein